MIKTMKKMLLTFSSLGLIIITSSNVIACTPLNDLEKSFNYNNNVLVDNHEVTIDKLGLEAQGTNDIYNFYFARLDATTTLKIVKVKPHQPVSELYFDNNYPHDSISQTSEIANLTANNFIGQQGLVVTNHILTIPVIVSLLVSYSNPDSKTGFSYRFSGLIMHLKINAKLQ